MEQPDSLELTLQGQNISCNGSTDGSIEASVGGGVGGYIFNWNNGQNTQEISDLVAGNYTLILQDANGCERSEQITIIEPEPINLELVDVADAICPGEATGVITVQADGGTTPYEFSTDGINFSQNNELGNLRANTYEVVVRDARGCLNRLEALVGEPLPFFVDAGEDQTINLGYSADLQAFIIPIGTEATLNWSQANSLSCDNCPNPEATPFVTTNYIITAINPVGCTAIDSVTVFVNKDRTLYIPNVFSPNEDGSNDQFTLFGGRSASKIQLLRIFSRWGELLFEASDIDLNNPLLGWDGTHQGRDMNPGVYVYYAEVVFLDQEVVQYEGDLTLAK
ncbi:MAG: T9SS type B sorting domain-containing protein [Saprospiraceae bacterium]|nr:T9SS type B sorting domain-containing protein [Saprospiraceae bacterium]